MNLVPLGGSSKDVIVVGCRQRCQRGSRFPRRWCLAAAALITLLSGLLNDLLAVRSNGERGLLEATFGGSSSPVSLPILFGAAARLGLGYDGLEPEAYSQLAADAGPQGAHPALAYNPPQQPLSPSPPPQQQPNPYAVNAPAQYAPQVAPQRGASLYAGGAPKPQSMAGGGSMAKGSRGGSIRSSMAMQGGSMQSGSKAFMPGGTTQPRKGATNLVPEEAGSPTSDSVEAEPEEEVPEVPEEAPPPPPQAPVPAASIARGSIGGSVGTGSPIGHEVGSVTGGGAPNARHARIQKAMEDREKELFRKAVRKELQERAAQRQRLQAIERRKREKMLAAAQPEPEPQEVVVAPPPQEEPWPLWLVVSLGVCGFLLLVGLPLICCCMFYFTGGKETKEMVPPPGYYQQPPPQRPPNARPVRPAAPPRQEYAVVGFVPVG